MAVFLVVWIFSSLLCYYSTVLLDCTTRLYYSTVLLDCATRLYYSNGILSFPSSLLFFMHYVENHSGQLSLMPHHSCFLERDLLLRYKIDTRCFWFPERIHIVVLIADSPESCVLWRCPCLTKPVLRTYRHKKQLQETIIRTCLDHAMSSCICFCMLQVTYFVKVKSSSLRSTKYCTICSKRLFESIFFDWKTCRCLCVIDWHWFRKSSGRRKLFYTFKRQAD